MKSIFYVPLFLALLLTNGLAQKKEEKTKVSDVKEFAGTYIYSSGFVGSMYKITANGKFKFNSFSDCCDPVWGESGDVSVNGDLLRFKLFKKTLDNYNLLDPKQATEAFRKIYDYKGEDVKADEIEKEYDLQIVKWGDRIYLIRPGILHLFVAAVNLGVEPRQNIIDRNFLTTRFYLRDGDEKKAVKGTPILPEPWTSYIQDSPVKATITKIELQEKEKIYTINKGSLNGIKEGMALIGEKLTPEYNDLLWIIAIEENSAKVKSFPLFRPRNYEVGSVLVSKISK